MKLKIAKRMNDEPASAKGGDRQQLGKWGEDLAARFLEAKGYQILGRNWRNRRGEIDLVAQDGGILAFVEVKTRRGRDFGLPEESITRTKGQRLLNLGQDYLIANDLADMDWRVDLVAIELDKEGKLLRCEHITNVVFGW